MKNQNNKVTYNESGLDPNIRNRLEAAILEIFPLCDFHEANMRLIAKNAGVSFGTIYKYYKNKNNLLFAFIDQWFAELADRIRDHLQGIEDVREKLRKVFWVQLDYFERHPEIGKIIWMTVPFKAWIDHETYRQNPLMDVILEVLREGQQKGVLNPDVRPGLLLNFVVPMITRSFIEWVDRRQRDQLTGEANVIFEMCWRAIAAPGRSTDNTLL